MLAKKRFVVVKYILLDMLHTDKVITIDEVMRLANDQLNQFEKMNRKQTKMTIVSVIENAQHVKGIKES